MAETFDLVFKGEPSSIMPARGLPILGSGDGRIAAIGDIAEGLAGEIIDAAGLHILPGVIDTQVHFREPGLEHKEDLATGSRAAVLGGVTAVFEMPNTKPADHDAEAPRRQARARAGPHALRLTPSSSARTADNAASWPTLERLPGAAGVKVFMGTSTGNLLVDDEETLGAHARRDQAPPRRRSFRGRSAAARSA